MTEPVLVDYEISVMEQYQYMLLLLKDQRFKGMDLEKEANYLDNNCEDDIKKKFIVIFCLIHNLLVVLSSESFENTKCLAFDGKHSSMDTQTS